jgi:hypothetical protein
MAHSDSREGKWRGNWRIEWVASTPHTTSEHGVSSITTADAHTSAASSRLNWRLRRFKVTVPTELSRPTVKTYSVSVSTVPCLLDVGNSVRRVASCTFRPLYPRESAPVIYWIERWMGLRSGLDTSEQKNFTLMPGIWQQFLSCPGPLYP